MENAGTVVFVDAYNIIYRAFHGNGQDLRNSEGFPTGAMYTALGMIRKMRTPDIQYALAVFDGGENFREAIDAEYKANRKPMPDDLKLQLPKIKEGLKLMGWPIYEADGVEADDVIGSLAVRAAKAGFPVKIFSGDKDFRAIVDDNITVVDTMHSIAYDRETVFQKMGVYPEQVRLYLTLMGDSSDNVAGVEKCGAKTAAEWCNKYKSYEALVAAAGELKNKVGENFRAAVASGSLERDYSLIGLKLDADVKLSKKELSFKEPDREGLEAFARTYGFNSWLPRDSGPRRGPGG